MEEYNTNPTSIQDVLIIYPKGYSNFFKSKLNTGFFRLIEHPPFQITVTPEIESNLIKYNLSLEVIEMIKRLPIRVFELVPILSLERLNEIAIFNLQRRPPEIQKRVASKVEGELVRPEKPPPRESELSIPEKPPPRDGALFRPEKELKPVEELFKSTTLQNIGTDKEFIKNGYLLLHHLNKDVLSSTNYIPYIGVDSENNLYGLAHFNDAKKYEYTSKTLSISGLFEITLKGLPVSKYKDVNSETVLLIEPTWFGRETAPGTKFFRLVEKGPLTKRKIMYRLFDLVPMSLEEINDIFGEKKRGGKTKRRNKNKRKSKKNKH